jgi:hypothetical protein
MKFTKTAVLAFAAMAAVAACGKKDNETADTSTIPGVDTTKGLAMPTTDTVVKTTTTDTVQGEVPRDSVKDSTKAKATTKKKKGY